MSAGAVPFGIIFVETVGVPLLMKERSGGELIPFSDHRGGSARRVLWMPFWTFR